MPIKNGPLVDGAWQIRGGHQTTINAFFGNYSAWGLRGLSCLNPSRNTCSKTETWPPTIFQGLDASITFRSVFRTKEEGTSAVTIRSWPSAFYLHRPRYKPPFLKFPSLRASSYSSPSISSCVSLSRFRGTSPFLSLPRTTPLLLLLLSGPRE